MKEITLRKTDELVEEEEIEDGQSLKKAKRRIFCCLAFLQLSHLSKLPPKVTLS